MCRQFHYHSGDVTEEHKANQKLKSSPTTQLVSQIVLSGGRTISYEYDAEDRITKVTDSVDGTTEYTYDALGQLLTEIKNGTVVNTMVYDNYGNIKSKNNVVYTYDSTWKDLLTKVGDDSISYDNQGNPTSYLGHILTWEKGRQLKSFDNSIYTYNTNGIRTSKTVNGIKHTYTLDGAKILRETWDNNTLVPLYDNEDSVCGIICNNDPYYFRKNLQGDIIAIVDKDAKEVARYSYDAWGSCTIVQDISDSGIAALNPFRYRGYYYDTENNLYYLNSRYYDPAVGRFINVDDSIFILTIGNIAKANLYSYCCNNNINKCDPFGYGMLNLDVYNMTFKTGIYPLSISYRDTFHYTRSELPTPMDQANYVAFNSGKYFVKSELPNGYNFYRHFLSAKGNNYYYNYYNAFRDDQSISDYIMKYLKQLIQYITNKEYSRRSTCYRHVPHSYYLTSNMCDVNCSTYDWQFALNKHKVGFQVSVSCFVSNINVSVNIIAMDRYQFDDGQSFYGIPDSWNGRFVTLGWAKFFNSIGTMRCQAKITNGVCKDIKFYS